MIDSRASNEEPNHSKSNVQKVPTHNQSKSFAQRLLQNQAKSQQNNTKKVQGKQEDLLKSV